MRFGASYLKLLLSNKTYIPVGLLYKPVKIHLFSAPGKTICPARFVYDFNRILQRGDSNCMKIIDFMFDKV